VKEANTPTQATEAWMGRPALDHHDDRVEQPVRAAFSHDDVRVERSFSSASSERSNGSEPASAAGTRNYLVASERAKDFALIFPNAQFEVTPPDLPSATASRDDALLAMIGGWMMHSGPVTSGALGYRLGLPVSEVEKALLRLEAAGTILRGNFTGLQTKIPTQAKEAWMGHPPKNGQEERGAQRPEWDAQARTGQEEGGSDPHVVSLPQRETAQSELGGVEWCERRLLARIHRLTVATLRKQVEPVTAAQFMRWLLRWQHVAPQTQLSGERGLLEAVRQLQGFEVPANAWERQVLAVRMNDYDPAALDHLCLTGAVGWGRLSPHPATLEEPGEGRRRVVPTSVAPITFFVREDCDWMQPRLEGEEQNFESVLSEGACLVLEYLRRRGASFSADIVRGTGKTKIEVETALWELVAAGMVTADGFENLRSLINPKRRAATDAAKGSRPKYTPGRWSLLYPAEGSDRNKVAEATCWMLLRRYGVVFREVLARESNLPKWRELLLAFRRLEDRGEVRGGRFVSGFLGEQFALPEAVESLRAIRNLSASGETITISAADPLNLVGFIVPGERVAAISGRYVRFRDGVAVEGEATSTPIQENDARTAHPDSAMARGAAGL
jgi:hypothetical protein